MNKTHNTNQLALRAQEFGCDLAKIGLVTAATLQADFGPGSIALLALGTAGVVLASGYLGKETSLTQANRVDKNAVQIQSNHPLHKIVKEVAATYNLENPVDLFEVDKPTIPVLCSLKKDDRIMIAFDRGLFSRLDDDEKRFLIAHELGHVARGDFNIDKKALSNVSGFLLQASMVGSILSHNPVGVIANLGARVLSIALDNRKSQLREKSTDLGAVEVTQNNSAAQSALQKTDQYMQEQLDTDNSKAIYASINKSWFANVFFRTHPKVNERTAYLAPK